MASQANILDPNDLFSFAQWLLAARNDEACYRSVIGRAYYSCFLTARDQLFGVDQRSLTNKVKKQIAKIAGRKNAPGYHPLVILAVGQSNKLRPAQAKRLSDQLSLLRDMRVQADYFRDSSNPNTVTVFRKYAVNDWGGLANIAMTYASNLLPELLKL